MVHTAKPELGSLIPGKKRASGPLARRDARATGSTSLPYSDPSKSASVPLAEAMADHSVRPNGHEMPLAAE